MKILAWFSLSTFVLGLLIAASPFLLLLAGGEDSEGGAALGWVFLFFTVPVGLLLTFVAIILILIAGIRGLANGSSRLFGILAITGACGSFAMTIVLILLLTNNLMADYSAPTTSPLTYVVGVAVLLVLGLVSTFVLAFSSSARISGSENSPVDA